MPADASQRLKESGNALEKEYAERNIYASLGSADHTSEETAGKPYSPSRDLEWRVARPHQLAYDYHQTIARPFSTDNLIYVIRAGAALMAELGSFVLGARHVREINFRQIDDAMLYLETKRARFPSIGGESDDIYRLAARRPFEDVKSDGRDTGFPRNRKKAMTSYRFPGRMRWPERCSYWASTRFHGLSAWNHSPHIRRSRETLIEVDRLNLEPFRICAESISG